MVFVLGSANTSEAAENGTCGPHGRSATGAMWLSLAHPGVGEWFLNGWGPFEENASQRRFWFGFIPFYGWPGYLQVRSAVDVKNCRISDDL